MDNGKYWKIFWNTNNIINRNGIHEKVGRTIGGKPIDEEIWNSILIDIENILILNSKDDILDIAAGSGAISIPFAPKVNSVTSLDISEKLLSSMKGIKGINTILADIRNYDFQHECFSKIILYFALQHFNEKETILLFRKIFDWLKPGGICLIGDIPDIERKFNFFNNKERESIYFTSIIKDEPIIGTWFHQEFLKKVGEYVGFKETILIKQPKYYINSHYRFDIKLTK